MPQPDMFLALSEGGCDIDTDAQTGSTDARCPGAIEVLAIKHEIEQIGSEGGGRPRSVEAVEHGELKILKHIDPRSPKLLKFCCMGEFINEARLLVYSAHGKYSWDSTSHAVTLPKPCMEYLMRWVHISSIELEGADEGAPTEWIGLKYGQIKVTWSESGIISAEEHSDGDITEYWSHIMEAPLGTFVIGGTTTGPQSTYTPPTPHWA